MRAAVVTATAAEMRANRRGIRALFARAMLVPTRVRRGRARVFLRGRWVKLLGSVRYDNKRWWLKAEPYVLLRVKRVFERVGKNEFGEVSLSDTIENARERLT